MSNRERWVIYPLLFLSIALAAKAQLDQKLRLDTEQIVCRELTVVDRHGAVQMQLAADRHGGMMALLDRKGAATVVINTAQQGGGQVLVGSAQQLGGVEIRGATDGGHIRLTGQTAEPVIVVGHPPDQPAGLTALRDNEPVRIHDHLWGLTLDRPADPAPSTTTGE